MKVIVINKHESVMYGGEIYKEGDTFEVSDAVGESLIKRGYVSLFGGEIDPEDEGKAEMKGKLDKEDLQTYKYAELKKLAAELGVGASGTKEELIEKICSVEVEIPADGVGEGSEGEGSEGEGSEGEGSEGEDSEGEGPNTGMPE